MTPTPQELRSILEDMAAYFIKDGGSLAWDDTRTHLAVMDEQGELMATLHVERESECDPLDPVDVPNGRA